MYELKTRVRFSESDKDRRMTIKGIIDLLQDTATFHSEDCGWTSERMGSMGLGWFILSWQIDIISFPALCQRLSSRTYSIGRRGLFVYRDYEVLDEEGGLLMKAHSIWVLMDLKRMLPERPSEDLINAYGHDSPVEGDWSRRKIYMPGTGYTDAGSFTAEEYMLDTNRHMNNSFYIEEAMRAMKDDERPKIRAIRTEYRKQTRLGERLYMKSAREGDGIFVKLLDGAGEISANICFRIGDRQ